MPHIRGSDHCPVYVDFHDEIDIEGRGKVSLWDEMNPGRCKEGEGVETLPPAFAIRNRDDFSGKQKTLVNYFSGGGFGVGASKKSIGSTSSSPSPASASTPAIASSSSSAPAPATRTQSTPIDSMPTKKRLSERSISDSLAIMHDPATDVKGKGVSKTEKGHLLSFFKPVVKITKEKSKKKTIKESPSPSLFSSSAPLVPHASTPQLQMEDLLATDYHASSNNDSTVTSTWSTLFQPAPDPLCDAHSEPAKSYTVNKSGPNKGRTFWLCSR
jgi:AP endonuclease-2